MKTRKGDIVEITFWDHCEDGPATLFTVWGRVKKVSKLRVEVASWDYTKPKRVDDNVKTFSIVQAAITKLKIL